MLKPRAVNGVAARDGRWRVPSSWASRRSVLTGCVAALGIVALVGVVRLSLPSVFDRGWESLVPGASHHKSPSTGPADLASSTRPSVATPSSAGSGSPVTHGTSVGTAVPSVATERGSPAARREARARVPVAIRSPRLLSRGRTRRLDLLRRHLPGRAGRAGRIGFVAVGLRRRERWFGQRDVDTGAGASAGVTIPIPDPSDPSPPTVTTSSVTTPTVTVPPVNTPAGTTPPVTVPTVTLPGLP